MVIQVSGTKSVIKGVINKMDDLEVDEVEEANSSNSNNLEIIK